VTPNVIIAVIVIVKIKVSEHDTAATIAVEDDDDSVAKYSIILKEFGRNYKLVNCTTLHLLLLAYC